MTALGIDIGGTRIKAGLVDAQGQVSASDAVPTPNTPAGFRNALRELVSGILNQGRSLAGVGIACKGIVEPETTRILTLPGTLYFLEGAFLTELVGIPGVPVVADNDARVALAGEIVFGAARGRRNVVMLTLGTGVGGGAVVEGNMLRGAYGIGGHLGHINVDPDGAVCICGNRGCLETVFSARAIEAEAIGAVLRGCRSSLLEYQGRVDQLTCRAVFDAAAQGDVVALSIRDRAVKYLAAAVAGLIFALDPEVVIIGGQIAEAGDSLFGPLRQQIWDRSSSYLGREVPIIPPQVGDRSGIVGAAALVVGLEASRVVPGGAG